MNKSEPVSDPLTYEKPLPLELMPYRERTDKFQSIGTAFAIGPNRFVSAAHVISAGNGSQYGPLALRDATGITYRIDKIIKYSSREDYAVFSVIAAPILVPLETRSPRGLGIRSSRFEMLVPAAVLKIDTDSVLMLKYSYMRDGTRTVWDLGGVYLANSDQKQKWVGLLRRPKPSTSVPEEISRSWRTITTGTHPWEGIPFVTGGRSEINAMANMKEFAAGKTTVGYTISLNSEGTQPANEMKSEFLALQRGFTTIE
jgi:hypothetical protein